MRSQAPGRGRAHPGLPQRGPARGGARRYTKRLADRLHAPWTALSIETRRSLQLDGRAARPAGRYLRLAESPRRGGHDSRCRRRIADTSSVSEANTSPRSSSASRRALLAVQLTRARWCTTWYGAPQYQLNVMPAMNCPRGPSNRRLDGPRRAFDPRPNLMALAFVASAFWCRQLIQPIFGIENVDLVSHRRVSVAVRSACCRRCLPASPRRCATISSFCRRSYLHDYRPDQRRGVLLSC